MGVLGTTHFCENGHIVLDLPHHHFVLNDPTKCQYCGSTNIRHETAWGDLDYGPDLVPSKPIGYEPHTVPISVYDVSELFKED